MNARGKKATRAAPPASLLVGWARQGMGSFMAAQRILLDLAAQENALLLGMTREQFGREGFRPGLCQDDAKASCCTKDEGRPFEVAL